MILEDPQAQLSLTLYYTAFDNDATIASYSKLENKSNQELSFIWSFFMSDFPAAAYEIVTLQGAYAREKDCPTSTGSRQGIFSISSNRGASGHAPNTSSSLYVIKELQMIAGNVFAIQLMYSGNFEAFGPKESIEWSSGGYWD